MIPVDRYLARRTRCRHAIAAVICAALTIAGCAPAQDSASLPGPSPAVQAVASDTPQIVAPPLHAGDVWLDRIRGEDREFRIESINTDGTMNVSFWGSEMTTDSKLNTIVYRSLTDAASDPTKSSKPGLWFAFPLYSRKTWVNDYTWETVGAFPITGVGEDRGRVFGWEDVTVPAGTFHALKAEVTSRFYGKGGMADESILTFWYSPKVNRFVKFDYHSNSEGTVVAELVKYEPAVTTN
ncbi:MAG: hypothetical protein ACLQDV_07930 [Candidatus Binataceae bacterium]